MTSEAPAWEPGPEWTLGPDGVHCRSGARVLLLDAADRVLLLRGHDVEDPSRSWWFTVGGGIDPGESPRAAAAREAREETGVVVDPDALVGPVLERTAEFPFLGARCRQDEVFFLARVAGADAFSREGWTPIEVASIDEVRWWTLDELDATTEAVYPEGLSDLVRGLLGGWDGVLRRLD